MTEETKLEFEEIEDEKVLTYCKRYIETWNKTEAYLAVHPSTTRMSAATNTFRLWTNPKVQATLQTLISDLVIGNDEILALLAERVRDKSNKQSQLKAIELVMRSRGQFLDRTDITTQGQKISWQQFINNEGEVKQDYQGITVIEK